MAVPGQLPAPDVAYPRIVGANGPKMPALVRPLSQDQAPPDIAAERAR